MEEPYEVPPFLKTLANECTQIISFLHDALLQPSVAPLHGTSDDITGIISNAMDGTAQALQRFEAAFNELGSAVSRDNPTDLSVIAASSQILSCCHDLVQVHRTVQRSAFPSGMELGRLLTANIVAKPLITILDALKRIVLVVEKPDEAVAQYGTCKITLSIVFEVDHEIALLKDWLDEHVAVNGSTSPPARHSLLKPLLIGLGIGWLCSEHAEDNGGL